MMKSILSQPSHGGNGHANGTHPAYGSTDMQERQITFRDYMRVMYRGRYLILISFLVVLISTIYFTFTTEPVYEASAKLLIEEKGGVGESLFDITSMMKKETMINNQVEILKSRTLAENVIRDLQASDKAKDLRILGNFPPGTKKRSNPLAFVTNLLKSHTNGKGQRAEDVTGIFDGLVESLRGSIEVTPIRNTDMIEIKVSALSPFEAAYVTNAVAEAYKKMNQSQSQAEVRQVKNFLQEQLDQYQSELARSEESLKNYQEKAKVVALDKETEELVRKLAEFETLYNEAKTDFQANKQRLAYIDEQLRQQHIQLDVESISSQPYLAELKKQIAEKEGQLAMYRSQTLDQLAYDQTKSEIQRRERQIDALKEKFKEEVAKAAATQFVDPAQFSGTLFNSKIEAETELQSLKPKVDALQVIVDQYNRQLESLPEKSLALARLMRKAQVDEKIYIMLQEKYQESRITEVGQLGIVRIIDPAKAPKFPVKPKKKLNLLLGIMVGLGLGIGLAFVMEYLDNSVRTMEDVQALGVPIMATIPFIEPEGLNGFLKTGHPVEDAEAEEINERLITHLKPKSPISEAYRTLRTNIQFSTADHSMHSLLVTSSGPKEGKSTSVSNLAITFSQLGTRTLLIDADLRRPVLHKLFNLEKNKGLTNVLVGRTTLEDSVQHVEGLSDLDILSCGIVPPNPAELLGSPRMQELLSRAKNQYSMILIDSPPTIAVTDASVLSPIVDGVLLVVKSGGTQRDAVMHALEQLQRVNAPLLGVLLNGIKASNVYGSYYYYYYYHYYYGSDGEKKKVKGKHQRKHSEKAA